MKYNSTIVSFFLLFGGFTIQSATAQIVYTDIPDQKLCAGNCFCGGGIAGGSCNTIYEQSYLLDFDNQAGVDLKIYATAGFFWGSVLGLHLKAIPLNGNEINASTYLPYALRKNSVIGPASDWSGDSSIFVSFCFPNPFIGCLEDTITEWTSGKEAYLGVKILKNNKTHYGWVRLYVNYSTTRVYCIIKDFAYQQSPDQTIKAGITGSGGGHGHGTNSISASDVLPGHSADADELKIFPIPVQSISTITFKLKKSKTVRMNIYDMTGQLVKTVVEKHFEKGIHNQQLDATAINAGIYFLLMQTGSHIQTRKLVIVK